MNIKFYLDTRNKKKGDLCPLKLVISHNGKSALYNLGINLLVSQFNIKAEKIENHTNKIFFNSFIMQRKMEIQNIILQLSLEGKLATMSATEVKNFVQGKIENENENNKVKRTIGSVFKECIDKKRKFGTKEFYTNRMKAIYKYANLDKLYFDDIKPDFSRNLVNFMQEKGYNQNTIIKTITALKAVFNYAIDNELTTNYPFRNLKLKGIPTRKRSLSISQLQALLQADVSETEQIAVDFFFIIFGLIGINITDLCNLTEVSAFGRVDYIRAKTGREYSIKVEPEVQKLLDKYKGEKHLLKQFDNAVVRVVLPFVNYNLKKVCRRIGLPAISTYWARHSWATIASGLDIPRDTIAHGLGHGNNTVTDIYIDFDMKKVDRANRAVLDVVYNKKC